MLLVHIAADSAHLSDQDLVRVPVWGAGRIDCQPRRCLRRITSSCWVPIRTAYYIKPTFCPEPQIAFKKIGILTCPATESAWAESKMSRSLTWSSLIAAASRTMQGCNKRHPTGESRPLSELGAWDVYPAAPNKWIWGVVPSKKPTAYP